METISITVAYLQIPIVILLAAHCIKVRHRVSGWISKAILSVIGCCVFFLGWRLATIDLITDPATRQAGGIGMQTLFIIAIYVLVSAIGSLSTHKK